MLLDKGSACVNSNLVCPFEPHELVVEIKADSGIQREEVPWLVDPSRFLNSVDDISESE